MRREFMRLPHCSSWHNRIVESFRQTRGKNLSPAEKRERAISKRDVCVKWARVEFLAHEVSGTKGRTRPDSLPSLALRDN